MEEYWYLRPYMKSLKKYQRSLITEIRFELQNYLLHGISQSSTKRLLENMELIQWLPSLQRVHVCVFPSPDWSTISFSACLECLHTDIEPVVRSFGCDMTIEKMSDNWSTFDQR
jgi:hypothetical protein